MRGYTQYCLERVRRERELQAMDRTRWYKINGKCVQDKRVLESFIESHCDRETDQFIERCIDAHHNNFFSTFFKSILRTLLNFFLTATSICGLLNCGSMFVFSGEQFKRFVVDTIRSESPQTGEHQRFGQLLDIGAGDGTATSVMSTYFDRVYATEISKYMAQRLEERGFTILPVDGWAQALKARTTINGGVTLISCLNVLDRCDKPLQMLRTIHNTLTSTPSGRGYLLLGLVFPFYQYVEVKPDHEPEEKLTVNGDTFEHQVEYFERNILRRNGFELVKWTKVPYLSEGNLDLSYFWLVDALFILRPIKDFANDSTPTSTPYQH